jgi:hypothetical protein
MDLDFAVIADYATNTNDGKLIVGGIFDTIWVPEVPAVQPFMTVVLRIQAHPGEEGGHQVRVRLVDPDGHEVIGALEAPILFAELDPIDGGTAQLILQLAGVTLNSEGRHGIDVFLDGRFERTIALFVRRAPAPPAE